MTAGGKNKKYRRSRQAGRVHNKCTYSVFNCACAEKAWGENPRSYTHTKTHAINAERVRECVTHVEKTNTRPD